MASLTDFVSNLASQPSALAQLKREPDALINRFGLSTKQANIVTSNDFRLLSKAISEELDDAEGNSSYLLDVVDEEEKRA